MLRLPTVRAQFPDLAEAAAREQMSYRGFLAELLMAECDDRARRRAERRIKAAGFPRAKSLRAFDFAANPSIDPAVINTLATCDWVKKGLPLCLIGDSGTGKMVCRHCRRHGARGACGTCGDLVVSGLAGGGPGEGLRPALAWRASRALMWAWGRALRWEWVFDLWEQDVGRPPGPCPEQA